MKIIFNQKVMKKIVFILASLMLLAGCWTRQKSNNDQAAADSPAGAQSQNVGNPANSNATEQLVVKKGAAPKKFYPDSNPAVVTEAAADGATTGARNFTITTELLMRLHLTDKYKPGTCYGLPGPVPPEAVGGMISRNPELAEFLKDRYKLATDLDVYNKIKQLNGIQLEKLASGKYKFNFTDGQCCLLRAYEGEVTVVAQTVTDEILRQESKQNPC